MSKLLKEEGEREAEASRPPAPVPAPAANAKSTEKDVSLELCSPRSETSMQVSYFTADSDSSFDLERLAPVTEEAETKTTASKDSDSSKNEAAIPSVKSTESKESSGNSLKRESDKLAKAASISPEKCTTPQTEKVNLQSNDETPERVAIPGVLITHQSLDPDIYKDLDVKELSPVGTAMVEEAWERLKKSFVYHRGKPVGTLAAIDPMAEALNYNQLFVRYFFPTGLACLMKDPAEPEIVKNFLLKTLHLQGREKTIDNFTLGEGVLPASFKDLYDSYRAKETLVADFGGSAIGRVAPVDSGFWWIILLRSYTICTHDYALAELPEVQNGMKLILNLCLSDGFDTFPTLLCADGCSMIDRRMDIYGYPIETQALLYFASRCAMQMLKPERHDKELLERIDKRITALSFHIQKYYWLDFTQLINIYRYKTEDDSHTAVNKFNVMPELIPDWIFDFMPLRGGYLIGNVSPACMDFQWFLIGNCISILSSLATPAQATAIMEINEERWADLISEMPLKIAYPSLERHEWRTITGFDPKNTRWSNHNGGSWPTLLWLLTAACIKTGRPFTAQKAIAMAEQRLSKESIPDWVSDFMMPLRGGCLIGNVSPACSSLVTPVQATATVPAAPPGVQKGAHVDKRKREMVEDSPSSSCESSSKRHCSIELVVDENGDDGADTLDGGVEGGLNVYWVDIYAHFLERIEGVEEMGNRLVLQQAVDDVLTWHQHPTDTLKVYYSRWTSQVLDELSITATPWEQFQVQVRGVHVYEPGENGEDDGE
ncbi:hypothetical protein M0R45_037255 [Rubus argutus]|uniref:Alkaline/neutral invertase n=1 Tax=Rubus argutus TaxID=59490 RepID=A0AAW1VYM5_RUBAR